jgi:hypothetical protein
LGVDDADVRPDRRHCGDPLAGEGAVDPRDPGALRQVRSFVAADDAERELRRTGCVCGRHAGVRMLLEVERLRPVVLDCVAQPVERPDAGVSTPGKDELARTAHPD